MKDLKIGNGMVKYHGLEYCQDAVMALLFLISQQDLFDQCLKARRKRRRHTANGLRKHPVSPKR